MREKRYDVACPLFHESFVLGGSSGSLLNWADCEEARGKTGTALRLWRQTAAKLVSDPERLEFAKQRVAALSTRVATLNVTLQTGVGSIDPTVTIGGVEVDEREPIPIDPGPNEVRVTARGYEDEVHSILGTPGQAVGLTILTHPRPVAPPDVTLPPPKPSRPSSAPDNTLIIAGWAVGAVGVAGLSTFGITAGLVAGACGLEDGVCPKVEEGYVNALNVANVVGVIVGGLGVGTGIVLLAVGYTRDAAPPRATGAALSLSPFGAEVRGWF